MDYAIRTASAEQRACSLNQGTTPLLPGQRRPANTVPHSARHSGCLAQPPTSRVQAFRIGLSKRPSRNVPIRPRHVHSRSQPPSGDKPLAAESPAASVERNNERVMAYTLIAFLLGVLGLCQVALPQQVIEVAYGATPLDVPVGLMRLVGGCYLMAAVVVNCLKEAADHGRLASDTYLRLNLGIFWWALGSLGVSWLARGAAVAAHPVVQGTYTALMLFIALTAGATYHATSPEGFSPPFLVARALESAGAAWEPSTLSSAAYGAGALLTGFGAVAILVGKLPVLQAPKLAAPLGALGALFLKLQGVGMLLASLVHYTLKDAACRGRLGASTFKALNAGVALLCINNLLVLLSWMRVGLLQLHGLRSPVVTASVALLGVALWNYFTAKK